MSWLGDTFTKSKSWDPLTYNVIRGVFKNDSSNVSKVAGALGMNGLKAHADKNVADPDQGVGRAAGYTAGAAAALYGGSALGAGSGAGAGEAGVGATAGGGATGAAADFGAGTYAAGAGTGGATVGAGSGAGALGASESGVGSTFLENGLPEGSKYASDIPNGSAGSGGGWQQMLGKFAGKMGGGMGGGGGGNSDQLAHQMRVAELLRQQREYDDRTRAMMTTPPPQFQGDQNGY